MIRTTLTTAIAIGALAAGAVWLGGAETALAPEPAKLTSNLTTTTAPAVFVNSRVETTAVKWPGSWTPNTTLAVGTPCSPSPRAIGYEVGQFIQANGNYRKCV